MKEHMLNQVVLAWKAIIRKPIRSLILLIIVLLLTIFIVSIQSISQIGIRVQDKSRQAIGASFRLEINEANRRQRLNDLEPIQYPNGAWGVDIPNNEFESLLLSDIQEIIKIKGLKTYNITTRTTPAQLINVKRIEDQDKDQRKDFGGVNLYGNSNLDLDFNFANGGLEIIEGRSINDADQNVIVISQELAVLNNLGLGDQIQFGEIFQKENIATQAAEVVGIFKINQPILSTMDGDTFRSENTIFSDLRFPEKVEGHPNDPCFKYATFQVEDIDDYDLMRERILATNINWRRYDLLDQNGVSETAGNSFANLKSVTEAIVIFVLISSSFILLLLFIFWLKGRVHEMAIYFSLGKNKLQILSQHLWENFSICLIAFILAFPTFAKTTEIVANHLVFQQVEQTLEQKQLDKDLISKSGNMLTSDESIADIKVYVATETIIINYLLILMVVEGTVIIASISFLKKEPMQMLNQFN